jgi:hypothetical protein
MRSDHRIEDEVEKVKSARRGDLVLELPGYHLHAAHERGEWDVWLNTEVANYDGLILGQGRTLEDALAAAVATIEKIHDALQGPFAAWTPVVE